MNHFTSRCRYEPTPKHNYTYQYVFENTWTSIFDYNNLAATTYGKDRTSAGIQLASLTMRKLACQHS